MGSKNSNNAIARATANGYKRHAHLARDSCTKQNKHTSKVIRDQDGILKVNVTWWQNRIREDEGEELDEDTVRARVLCKGAPALEMVEVKDFLRFYLMQSKGRINEHASVESVKTNAEWYFPGFERVTGTPTDPRVRSEVFWWIKKVLPDEGHTIDQCLPKHNFTRSDLDAVLLTLWTQKDLQILHERDRVQFMLLLHTYCWTGARIGAFFTGEGLRWKDIHLVLRRRANTEYELIWKIDQRWVKNNRSPETHVFGASGKEHGKLLYNDGALLLALAFASKALYGFETLDDFWQQEIPPGEDKLILRWNDTVLEQRVLSMSRDKFTRTFKASLVNAGYFCSSSIHQIRRQLGKKVDERYTEVERSQHILQADPRIFGQSYVAECSAVDGMSAFLDEPADHTVTEYFQGVGQYRELPLPTSLPAALKADLEDHPDMLELKDAQGIASGGSRERAACRQLRNKLEKKALVSFQQRWVRQTRDWKILTRGKISQEVDGDTDQLNLVIPERERTCLKMQQKEHLTQSAMREAIQDIYALCVRDTQVFYPPGDEPVNGLCPVCGAHMKALEERYRSNHIHDCRRTQKATQLNQLRTHLEYCYDCQGWYVKGPEWDEHCQGHLSKYNKRCGVMIYCKTLIKPAFCPDCLCAELSPSIRRRSWKRNADVLSHIAEHHLKFVVWPSVRPCCNIEVENERAFLYHLSDVHGLTDSESVKRLPVKRLPAKRKADVNSFTDLGKKQGVDGNLSTDDKFPSIADLRPASTFPNITGKAASAILPVYKKRDGYVWGGPEFEMEDPTPKVSQCSSPSTFFDLPEGPLQDGPVIQDGVSPPEAKRARKKSVKFEMGTNPGKPAGKTIVDGPRKAIGARNARRRGWKGPRRHG